MNPSDLAIIAENTVLLAAIGAGWHLFRQGGGWQFKTPPVPKAPPQEKRDTKSEPKPGSGASADAGLSVLDGAA